MAKKIRLPALLSKRPVKDGSEKGGEKLKGP